MTNPKKKPAKRFLTPVNFEEIDHRLSCGWHVEVEESGQRKRYLKQVKNNSQNPSENKVAI